MACVWKHPESKFWFARYRDANGRRVNRSTQETSRRTASIMAEQWERAARNAAHGKLTRGRAKDVLDEILASTGLDPIPTATVEEVLRGWQKDVESEKSAATANRYRGVVDRLLEHLGDRANAPVTLLGTADIQSFVSQRARERAAKTASNDLRCLSAAFNRAVRLGTIDRNPCLGVEAPSGPSLERKPFSAAQVALLIEAAPNEEWRTLIRLCWFTGLRIGDAASVEWSQLDLASGTLTVRQQKTEKEIVLPLHPELQTALESIAGDEGGPLLPELSRAHVGGKLGLSAQFGKIVVAAGLDEERQTSKGGRSLARYSAHSLRHGATTALADAGVHPDIRQKITGHADARAHAVYSHHAIETLRSAVAKIPSLQS